MTVIKVEPDGQSAMVADETFESVTFNGKTISTVSRGTSILELEDGKLVITHSEATACPYNLAGNAMPSVYEQ